MRKSNARPDPQRTLPLATCRVLSALPADARAQAVQALAQLVLQAAQAPRATLDRSERGVSHEDA